MKKTHWLIAAVCALSFLACDIASAGCRWVPGHRDGRGVWVAGHNVCGGNVYRNCKWVDGYRGTRGYWHEGHRVCW